eukprot:scaffold34590_cov22-Cyclotella_meneghiniana.AAC.2
MAEDSSALRSRNRGSVNTESLDRIASATRLRREQNPLLNDFDEAVDSNINAFDSPIPITKGSQSQQSYGYRVYPERWLMLFYLSLLNLLSDWAGLSVAPIATLTISAYTEEDNDNSNAQTNDSTLIQPEALVT